MTMVVDPPTVGVDLPLEPEVGTEPVPEVRQPDYAALADLMREGARRRGQCRRELFRNGRSCAWGAVWEALTGCSTYEDAPPSYGINQALRERLGVDVRALVPGPPDTARSGIREPRGDYLWSQVVYLNDILGWTRERIADYIASLGSGAQN